MYCVILLLARLALLLQLLERRDHGCISCMMIDAVMYGMIPSANSDRFAQRAAREQVEQRSGSCRPAWSKKSRQACVELTPGTGSQEPNR